MAFGRKGKQHKRNKERTGTPSDLLVVGLGNPGPDYEGTRHNVGVEVVELLAERHGGQLRGGREAALVDEIRIGEHRVALAFPQTYMNRSGESIRQLVRRYGIADFERLVIAHDELDLAPGDFRVKVGGGLAGHNGLRSTREHLKTTDFVRLRLGVGKPPAGRGADYVLKRPGKADRATLDDVIVRAADAVEVILVSGPTVAMNQFNARATGRSQESDEQAE